MLSNEAQQSLPQDAQVALQQVDNRMSWSFIFFNGRCIAGQLVLTTIISQIFLDFCPGRLDS